MPNTEKETLNNAHGATSARELRIYTKKTQSENAKLAMFQALGIALLEQGWTQATKNSLLNTLCIQFGAAHGMIAMQDGSTLTVAASQGQTFPVGARIPITGSLASFLKPPMRFALQKNAQVRLWSYPENAVLQPFIAPILLAQNAVGILAFASKKSAFSAEELSTCQSLCGFIAVASAQSEAKIYQPKDDSLLQKLTPREREVFALMPSGQSNAELALRLDISPGTVKIHVERILNKLGLRDRTQAAVKAVELGYKS